MRKGIVLLSIISGVFSLTTCTKDVYVPNTCFKEDILPIFVSNCTMSGCHNTIDKKEGYDLSNYDGIMTGVKVGKPNSSEIFHSISGNDPEMPEKPYPKLSKQDVTKIKSWIQMGAKNSSNCTDCDTTNYTYSGRVNPIIQTWCKGCHSATSPGGGINLSSYSGVVSSIPNNQLLGSIKHVSTFSAMPKGTAQLSQCDIDAVEKWINAGFPNN